MIKLNINNRKIVVSELDSLVVGNVNSISVKLIFSAEWNGLARTAVFANGEEKKSVYIDSDTCRIPWEMLTEPGEMYISLRGMGDEGELVICTENASLGRILPSNASEPVAEAEAATPNVIDALIAATYASTGKSAYDIAVNNGFEGTETEWLNSLKGADGIDGINGTDGVDGVDGTDGYTPVKGVDYFTAADKAEFVSSVLTALPEWEGGSY